MTKQTNDKRTPPPRRGMPSPRLNEYDFKARFRSQFLDQNFAKLQVEFDKVTEAAWDAYAHSRKSPRTRRAGPQFADRDYDLAEDWISAREAVETARGRYENNELPPRILLINCSSRSEHTCPGEMSKSYRLIQIAREVFETGGRMEVELLDCRDCPQNTAAKFIPAKRVSQPRRRCVTGRVLVIQITHWAKRKIG